ncbi:CPBP family intramembrane metalloprotease [Haloferax sp. MBLA0076]|uniref:CPBP family intramembrane metalloprotease n=1 Tax=Haloferax litoreum TaxID=2666140 RepID=A0A6A8GIN3_9EURY|nr:MULTISPECIES: CPBP family glutamic-type intramembrane protease [Haloferax]KAB1193078.1 CPBP family intramembrane metalloprotease [Haloferax sp. CBA1148]MRX21570.1 CPBP family intramembrane metalloprotease [Haloferax litoreum]
MASESTLQRQVSRFTQSAAWTPRDALFVAVGVYALWVIATFVFEGRIQTLLRPDATFDRLVYAVVANLLVGTVLAMWVVRRIVAADVVEQVRAGFQSALRTVGGVVVAAAVGLTLYVVQNPPSTDPMVVGNVFAQVLPTSIAEVVVCWVLVGATVEAVLRGRGSNRYLAIGVAIVTASVLFGVYHVAHSPPFNTLSQVVLLTVVGVVTSLVFFLTRDVYATVVFHTMLALTGVTQSLADAGRLGTFTDPVVPLFVVALVAVAVLVAADVGFVRRARGELHA